MDLGGYGESGFGDPQNVFDPLTGMLRDGARVLINTAVRCELEQFLRRFEDLYLEDGRAAVVRNGYHPRREVQTGIGPVTVQIPKVRSRDGSPATSTRLLCLPTCASPRGLKRLCHGFTSRGFPPGRWVLRLKRLWGRKPRAFTGYCVAAQGEWAEEYGIWRKRDLGENNWVYVWADGIYSKIRGDNPKLCVLVVIGLMREERSIFSP